MALMALMANQPGPLPSDEVPFQAVPERRRQPLKPERKSPTAAAPVPAVSKSQVWGGEKSTKQTRPLPVPRILNGGLVVDMSGRNSASNGRWAERPVQRMDASMRYEEEEEEDPDLQCYLWNRREQRPKMERRPFPAAQHVTPSQRSVVALPPAGRQRNLVGKVVEMGFDEASARHALAATGWGVEAAVASLLSA